MSKQARILVGISGSGKSTMANILKQEWGDAVEINRDTIRTLILDGKGVDTFKDNIWKHWKFKSEPEVTTLIDEIKTKAIAEEQNLIFSDTNLSSDKTYALKEELDGLGYETEILIMDVPLDTCITRDRYRKNVVGEDVIYKQYMKLLKEWGVRRQYTPMPSKPKCIMVDVDGTLAHMDGKRGPFEWSKVGGDSVDTAVAIIVRAYAALDYKVIILSGRDSVCRPETEEWLQRNNIPYNQLLMRAANDQRKDTIVKEEIFWGNIAEEYNVELVIDDRPSVVKMWHDVGIKVLQCGNAYLSF